MYFEEKLFKQQTLWIINLHKHQNHVIHKTAR